MVLRGRWFVGQVVGVDRKTAVITVGYSASVDWRDSIMFRPRATPIYYVTYCSRYSCEIVDSIVHHFGDETCVFES